MLIAAMGKSDLLDGQGRPVVSTGWVPRCETLHTTREPADTFNRAPAGPAPTPNYGPATVAASTEPATATDLSGIASASALPSTVGIVMTPAT